MVICSPSTAQQKLTSPELRATFWPSSVALSRRQAAGSAASSSSLILTNSGCASACRQPSCSLRCSALLSQQVLK